MLQNQPFVFTSVLVIPLSWYFICDFFPTFPPSVFLNTSEICGGKESLSVVPIEFLSRERKTTGEEEN